jgi:hypothetical protein
MNFNKKVKFDYEEIMEYKNSFNKEKGIDPTHCSYNPKLVDKDHFLYQAETYAIHSSKNRLTMGIDFRLYGIDFFPNEDQQEQLKFMYVEVIE